jgi:putative ABC transport system permease protein
MTECLLLGGLACAAGVALAAAGLRLMTGLPLDGIPRIHDASLDAPVLIFAVLTGLVTTVLFGLAPAWRLNRAGARQGSGADAHSTATSGNRRISGALVALQFALSLILLVGAGLLLRSLQLLLAVDPGFDATNVLTLRLYLPPVQETGYENPYAPAAGDEGQRTARFYLDLADRVRVLPGVRSAALVSSLPLTGDIDADGTIVEGHEPSPGDPVAVTRIVRSGPGYFGTMRIAILRGRDFADSDRETSMPVAIVDETFARRYWPDGNAIGQRIRYAWNTEQDPWMTIVGVVAGIRDESLAEGQEPHLYIPFSLEPHRGMHLVARTEGHPEAAIAGVRAALRDLDPGVPAFAVQSLDQTVGASLSQQKFANVLLALFAAIALLLAAAGIYGVMSLEVNSRVKELAIRIALGARPSEVFGLVIGHGARLAGAGLVAGLAGALALTRLLAGLLFEVAPTDPATFAAVIALLAAVAFVASAAPARHATRVDPIAALRLE